MRWYAGMVGELVPYLGDFMGEYKSREDSGCTNFVQHGDAEVIVKEQDNEKLERLQKAVLDTKAAYVAYADAAYGDAAYAAWGAWVKAKLELEDYLKEHGDDK